jgi:hypothetical protein
MRLGRRQEKGTPGDNRRPCTLVKMTSQHACRSRGWTGMLEATPKPTTSAANLPGISFFLGRASDLWPNPIARPSADGLRCGHARKRGGISDLERVAGRGRSERRLMRRRTAALQSPVVRVRPSPGCPLASASATTFFAADAKIIGAASASMIFHAASIFFRPAPEYFPPFSGPSSSVDL